MNQFEDYLTDRNSNKYKAAYAWSTAIGLQDVDGLDVSDFLIKTAISHIEGEITIEEAHQKIYQHYEEQADIVPPSILEEDDQRTDEADKVSLHIVEVLLDDHFEFTPEEYLRIHGRLFDGIFEFAGKIRDYNIFKEEWILEGDTVIYGKVQGLKKNLEREIDQERVFIYAGLTKDQMIHHLAIFLSDLWKNHVFGEGNTRTTAVFFIKYLNMVGFKSLEDTFAENSMYFRNALVRANYNDELKNVKATTYYLELFLKNLIFHQDNKLRNRYMHVSGYWQPGDEEEEKFVSEKKDLPKEWLAD